MSGNLESLGTALALHARHEKQHFCKMGCGVISIMIVT